MTRAFFLGASVLFAGGVAPAPVTMGDRNRWADIDPGLRQAFERTVYALHSDGSHWRGQNRAQRLSIEFDGEGATLRTHGAAVAFRLTGYGYGEKLYNPGRSIIVKDDNRVEYRRPELTEWYVNGEKGLEQGFTFARHPAERTGEPLTVSLDLTGALRPHLMGAAVVLEGRNGTTLRYAGLTATDAEGRTLPSRMEVRGSQIRLLVDDAEAHYPLIIDPTWTSQTLQPSGAVEAGHSVAMSGSTVAVGDPGYSSYQGAVYVYTYSGSAWNLQATLVASDGQADDGFGSSVAIDGPTIVAGAYGRNSGEGAAYVFTQSGGSWTQETELIPSDGASGFEGGDSFGQAVAISGTTVIVGSPYHQVGSNYDEGAAYIFTPGSPSWNQTELQPSLSEYGNFGWSVAINGSTALVGAPYETVSGVTAAGSAYVFTQNDGSWSEQYAFTPASGSYALSGWSVAISGATAVVAAVRGSTDGEVFVYFGSGSSWSQQGSPLDESVSEATGRGDEFGYSVGISGPLIIVGAYEYWYEDEYEPGRVYVFQGSTQVADLASESTDNNYDGYGYSVAGAQGWVIGGAIGKSGGGAAIISSTPASLSISATHASPVFQSGPINLSLAVSNAGLATAAAATVSDIVPSDLTINAAPGCLFSGQSVTCTVSAGATGINTFNIYTTASASAASSLSNTATLSDSTDTVTADSSTDTITIGSQAPLADSNMSQTTISGSTNGGACADGNNTLTATVQLENMSVSTMTNPYAVNITLSNGNTLISNTSNADTVSASGNITFTFDIQLASCNTFHLGFDVRSN